MTGEDALTHIFENIVAIVEKFEKLRTGPKDDPQKILMEFQNALNEGKAEIEKFRELQALLTEQGQLTGLSSDTIAAVDEISLHIDETIKNLVAKGYMKKVRFIVAKGPDPDSVN